MRHNYKRLLAAACGLATLAGGRTANALDKYLDLEPPQTKSGVGYGYNSISREFVLRQCVQFNPTLTEGGSGASGDDFKFSSVVSNAQLADEMGLTVATKFSASMGVASVAASAKVDFFQSTTTNFLTHTILASYNDVEPMRYVAGELSLKPEYLAIVGTPEFRAKCGDYVIIGEQKGRWFYGTVQLAVKDTATESKLAADGAVDFTYGAFSGAVSTNTINKLKQASKTQDLQIRVTTSGTDTASLTLDQFLAQVQAFPGKKNDPKQTYKLKAVPFESIVTNWPAADPLAPLTSAQKLTRLAEAAWGLTALIDDSDFVTQNPKLFALGTTPAKRDARLAHIKARRGWYQAQLDDMRKRAKNCDVDWSGIPACESLYKQWNEFEAFVVGEYDQFPARYVSDCYAPRDASGEIQQTLALSLKEEIGQFSNTKGDREVGGGPVSFRATLDFKPDHTGGDKLATRKLLSTLRIKMEEMGADHTTFETTLKRPVVDLAKPDLSQGAPITLGQCAYRDTGVKTALVGEDPSVCDGLKAIPAAYKSCKDVIAAAKYHGILRGKTGEDPRVETFNKNSKGVLSSMRCTVDSDAGNDTPAIGCDAIQLRSVQLDLVNTQDVRADSWVAPKPDAFKIPAVANAKSVYAGIMKRKTSVARKLNAPAKTCKAGLVAVDGECVPQLKR